MRKLYTENAKTQRYTSARENARSLLARITSPRVPLCLYPLVVSLLCLSAKSVDKRFSLLLHRLTTRFTTGSLTSSNTPIPASQ